MCYHLFLDLAAPILLVTDATTVEVWWSPPTSPNGIILSYEVSYKEVTSDVFDVAYSGLPVQLKFIHLRLTSRNVRHYFCVMYIHAICLVYFTIVLNVSNNEYVHYSIYYSLVSLLRI